ncbi:MAG: hypothetical protein U1E77_09095 [Inhella sp.]
MLYAAITAVDQLAQLAGCNGGAASSTCGVASQRAGDAGCSQHQPLSCAPLQSLPSRRL